MSTDPLRAAARPRIVGKYVGQFAIVLAALNVVPLAASFALSDEAMAWRFMQVTVALMLAGIPLARIRTTSPIQKNEALVVGAIAYILAAAVTAYPLAVTGGTALDAWFEGVSGVTTTGLSTYAHPELLPRSHLFARAWSQWYGGLGIVVLSVALLRGHDVSARRLVDNGAEELVTVTRLYARRMLVVYVVLSAAVTGMLMIAGCGPFDAVVHMLAAVSTGGFSTHDASIAALGSGAAIGVATAASLLGSIALPVYYRTYQGKWRELVKDEELQLLLAATLIVCALLYVLHSDVGQPDAVRFRDAIVMGISAQSTTGYASTDVMTFGPAGLVVLMLAMASGGSVGSTAGGVKLMRILLLFRLLGLMLKRLAMPSHAVAELRLGGERVGNEEIARGMLLVFLFLLTVLISWIPFLLLGHDPLRSLFEVVSATGTAGLSAGVTDSSLDPLLKLVLCADMLLGRLEFVAVLILFSWPTWVGRRSAAT